MQQLLRTAVTEGRFRDAARHTLQVGLDALAEVINEALLLQQLQVSANSVAKGLLSHGRVRKWLVHIDCSLRGRPGAARKLSRLWSPSSAITAKRKYSMVTSWCIRS